MSRYGGARRFKGLWAKPGLRVGQKFVEPPTFDISKSFADSVPRLSVCYVRAGPFPGINPLVGRRLSVENLAHAASQTGLGV